MKTAFGVLTAFVLALGFSGCATMNKKNDTELQSLKTQIADLEARVQRKDSEIEGLRQALSKTTEEKYNELKDAQGSAQVSTQVPTPMQIQTALANAGFNPGTPDGKLGGKTRKAIKDFQKANGLTPDGKVGPKTWNALASYLEKKTK
jgi:murein L,D-transpeptidase YcbB/YkuD